MNLLFSVLYLLITFTLTVLIHKYFKKEGLFIWICVSVIISNIQSVKIIEYFGIPTALGNIAYANVFLATDILNETEGVTTANKSVLYSFLSMFIFAFLMYFSTLFVPSSIDASNESLKNIFTIIPRITLASLLAYLVSQLLDVFLYNKLKMKYNKLWLSNNLSTITSQLLDTIIFVVVAYVGTMTFKELCMMALTMFVLKTIIALVDTFFIYYVVRKSKPREKDNGYSI